MNQLQGEQFLWNTANFELKEIHVAQTKFQTSDVSTLTLYQGTLAKLYFPFYIIVKITVPVILKTIVLLNTHRNQKQGVICVSKGNP